MDNQKVATKILIVDDNKSIRTVLCVMLRDEGYEVVGELSGGENFISTVERLRPNIICLDQDLPDTNGLVLLRQLHEKKIQVAVVMITGTTDPAIQKEAVESGVDGFLKKPFNQTQVLNELKLVDHARKLLDGYTNPRNSDATGVNVLLADDSSIMRDVLNIILKGMGLNIVGEARDGNEVISLASQFKPQAIFLDLNMPNMGGMEALEKIKKVHPDIQVIIVSAHSERDKVRRAVELGACGFIIKPYESKQVVDTVRKLLFG